MNLKEYLFYTNMTVREFGKIADISPCHLSSVMTGQRTITPKILRAITRATEGLVTEETAFMPTKLPIEFTKVVPLPEPEPLYPEQDEPKEQVA